MAKKKIAKKKSKKTPDVALSKKDRAKLLADELNTQFGGRAEIITGDQLTNMFILRRPTGILSLDLKLGGGFPSGGLSQIIGKDGSGKTYLSNRVIAEVQQTYVEDACIGLCMTEMPYDKEFAKYKCGVRIAYSEEEIAMGEASIGRKYTEEELVFLRDQIGTVHHAVGGTAETILEMAAKMIESNLYQVVLIDSFGALLTKAEADADDGIESKHYGGAAMVITQFMHRVHSALNIKDQDGRMNTTTILGINQYRDNIGAGLYGNPMKISGGNALRHGKLVDLKLTSGSKIFIVEKGQRVVLGKEINWEILKGKAGCHDGPKGKYAFNFADDTKAFGSDILADVITTAVKYGLISQAGAWLTLTDVNDNEIVKAQGVNGMVRALTDSPEVVAQMTAEVFKAEDVKFITNEGP